MVERSLVHSRATRCIGGGGGNRTRTSRATCFARALGRQGSQRWERKRSLLLCGDFDGANLHRRLLRRVGNPSVHQDNEADDNEENTEDSRHLHPTHAPLIFGPKLSSMAHIQAPVTRLAAQQISSISPSS